jgi:hypothetical protein
MICTSGAAALHGEVPAAIGVRDVHAGEERAVDRVANLDPGAAREGLVGLDVAQTSQIGSDAVARRTAGPKGRRNGLRRFSAGEGKGGLGRDHVAQESGIGGVGEEAELEPLPRRSWGRRRIPASAAGIEGGLGGRDPCVVRLLGGLDLSRKRA